MSPHIRNDPPGNWREGGKRENETVGEDREEGRELVTWRKDGEGCALSHERSLRRHMAELSSLMGRRREGLSGMPPTAHQPFSVWSTSLAATRALAPVRADDTAPPRCWSPGGAQGQKSSLGSSTPRPSHPHPHPTALTPGGRGWETGAGGREGAGGQASSPKW